MTRKSAGGQGGRDRRQHREHAGRDRDALAAVEPQPDRIDVSDNGRGRGQRRSTSHRRAPPSARATASAPFATSSAMTMMARRVPVVRSTFAAPDVAAAGEAHVDAGAPRQQERERHRSGEVSEQDGPHHVNGTRSSGSYDGSMGRQTAAEQGERAGDGAPAVGRYRRQAPGATRRPARPGSFTRAIVRCGEYARASGM